MVATTATKKTDGCSSGIGTPRSCAGGGGAKKKRGSRGGGMRNVHLSGSSVAGLGQVVNWTQEREDIVRFWMSLASNRQREILTVNKADLLQRMKEQSRQNLCNCDACVRRGNFIDDELDQIYDHYYSRLVYAHRPLAPPAEPHRKSDKKLVHNIDQSTLSLSVSSCYAWDHFEDHFDHVLYPLGDGKMTVAGELLEDEFKKLFIMLEHSPMQDLFDYGDDDDSDSYVETEDEGTDAEYSDDELIVSDEDEDASSTAEERFEESRRMFQIFSAKLMQEKMIQAYREKVAADNQEKFLQELEEEEKREKEMEMKKKQKKANQKEKKRLEKLQKQEAMIRKQEEDRAKQEMEEKRRREDAERRERERISQERLEKEKQQRELEEKLLELESKKIADTISTRPDDSKQDTMAGKSKKKRSKRKKKEESASVSENGGTRETSQTNTPTIPENPVPNIIKRDAATVVPGSILTPPPGFNQPMEKPELRSIVEQHKRPEGAFRSEESPRFVGKRIDPLSATDPVVSVQSKPLAVNPIGFGKDPSSFARPVIAQKVNSGLVPNRSSFDPFRSRISIDLEQDSYQESLPPPINLNFLFSDSDHDSVRSSVYRR